MLAVVVIGVVYVAKRTQWEQQAREKEPTLLTQMGFGSATPMQLDAAYTDADGDLIADAPKDPKQQVSPDKLVFAFIASDTADIGTQRLERPGRQTFEENRQASRNRRLQDRLTMKFKRCARASSTLQVSTPATCKSP